jgi:hypothetical protein
MSFVFKQLNDLVVSSITDPSLTKDLHTSLIHHRSSFQFKVNTTTLEDPLSQMLSLSALQTKALESLAESQQSKFKCSLLETAIYIHFMERELLLNTLEILVSYYKSSNSLTIRTIDWFVTDIMRFDIVKNLIGTLKAYKKTISELTPLATDSTTIKRDHLISKGIKDFEIETFMVRVQREIEMIGLVLMKIAIHLGLTLEELKELILALKETEDSLLFMVAVMALQNPSRLKPDFEQLGINDLNSKLHQGTLLLLVCSLMEKIGDPTQTESLAKLKRIWMDKFTLDSTLFQSIQIFIKNIKTLPLKNNDIVKDQLQLVLKSFEKLMKSFVVDFKKIFR